MDLTKLGFKNMSKITSTIWEIEPHTEAKHTILRKYLNAWLPIITRWNGRVLYIDGFAGPGEYVGGKDGSPVIAIKTVLEHRMTIRAEIIMLFIEADKERCEFLKTKLATLEIPQNINPKCICAKFDETLTEILDYLDEQTRRLAPAFVFIDPFGFSGMPFTLIKRIMKNKKCEVLVTFMYEEINRFIGNKDLWDRLTETFGTDEWKQVIPMEDTCQRCDSLHSIYKRQLEEEAGIKFVRSFEMVNKTNRTDYFLFFGTNNFTGLKKMKEAMWKVDESGSFQFSDATYNPAQPMLFEIKPNYEQLKKIILQCFKGKSITIEELENFVLTQTPFIYYKRQVLAPMERSLPHEIEVKCQDVKRRQGNFPAGCSIRFL